ncbi:hypothetical protein K9B35_14415 [Sphingomonas sp. R647]|uniref:hypothetical protein n=1 Tax=Sphingomonas sp. R647 TaxID=2875233 RepID=UPI001CD23597|nr:hypothetical protein [Sphingomonas sp. R647]MCA1199168.1 hypothetical protein [Sphingomonas sp. R647]
MGALRTPAAQEREIETPIWPRDRACPLRADFAPMARPIVLLSSGDRCIVPHPSGHEAVAPIARGTHLAWAHAKPVGDVALVQFGGNGEPDGLVTILSRAGLRSLIADLQAIDAQLGDR